MNGSILTPGNFKNIGQPIKDDSKRGIFKMITELKEDMGKVKKAMYGQNGNINKEILKRKPK